MDSIDGDWIGEYKYGKGYNEDFKGKSVKFSIKLFTENEILRGTCLDEDSKSIFSSAAVLEGTYENGTIIFYKTYPPSSEVSFENRLEAEEYNSMGSIQYIGNLTKRLFSKTYYFEGTWEISYSRLNNDKVPEHYAFQGTWKMQRPG